MFLPPIRRPGVFELKLRSDIVLLSPYDTVFGLSDQHRVIADGIDIGETIPGSSLLICLVPRNDINPRGPQIEPETHAGIILRLMLADPTSQIICERDCDQDEPEQVESAERLYDNLVEAFLFCVDRDRRCPTFRCDGSSLMIISGT